MKIKVIPLLLIPLMLSACVANEPGQTGTTDGDKTEFIITVPTEQTQTPDSSASDTSDAAGSRDTAATDAIGIDTSAASTEKPQSTTQTTAETQEPSDVVFVSDLSAYEKYMNPSERDAYLLLVNPANPLDESYVPSDLTDVVDTRDDGRATQQMALYAEKSLEAFLIEARACGCKNVSVTSAYRSYSRQSYLFNIYVEQEMAADSSLTRAAAEAIVLTYSCRAGTSEHQSGLCCDMHNMSSAQVAFAKTDEAKWLAENAWKFGFILRFPEEKTEITGISYEPWHFRYVGRYHAERMRELNMCLEEYVAYLKGE